MLPRYGIRSLLIVFAMAALWFSTFAGYSGSEDIRAFIMLTILITSGVAAISSTTRRRAFWAGFFGTMLAVSTKLFFLAFVATFRWMREFSTEWAVGLRNPTDHGELAKSINATIFLGMLLIMATAIGLLCVHVYDACTRDHTNAG
jgi:hypothetical protein